MAVTGTEEFNTALEIQQSKSSLPILSAWSLTWRQSCSVDRSSRRGWTLISRTINTRIDQSRTTFTNSSEVTVFVQYDLWGIETEITRRVQEGNTTSKSSLTVLLSRNSRTDSSWMILDRHTDTIIYHSSSHSQTSPYSLVLKLLHPLLVPPQNPLSSSLENHSD